MHIKNAKNRSVGKYKNVIQYMEPDQSIGKYFQQARRKRYSQVSISHAVRTSKQRKVVCNRVRRYNSFTGKVPRRVRKSNFIKLCLLGNSFQPARERHVSINKIQSSLAERRRRRSRVHFSADKSCLQNI